MLPVYICDDESGVRCAEKEMVERLILMEGYDMEVVYADGKPEKLLETVRENGSRGVYFLDVDLKGESMDGFVLGQEIRKIDPRGFLIYVTSFGDLAFQTFRYHLEALDYIVKGTSGELKSGIGRCLEVVKERLREERDENQVYFTVKVMDVVKHVPLSEIYFFETEARSHRVTLHGMNHHLDFLGSLQDLEEQLGNRFVRTHRAYLVNLDRIRELDLKHNTVIMENGEHCMLARSAKKMILTRI